MSSRTVALVTDSTGFGGSELCLANIAAQLRERWRFVGFVPEAVAAETSALLGQAGVELRPVPGLRRIPRLRPLRALRHQLVRLDPALVHVSLTDQGDGLAPLLATRRLRAPVAATLNLVVPGRRSWREAVSRRALGLPALVICVSESVGEYARSCGARATVVPNGVARPDLRPDAREALGLDAEALVVGGIGRLDRQKGWDVLCEAAALLAPELPQASFVVLGDGPERERLASLRGSQHVRFLGQRDRAASYLSAFDLLVVPSRYEAFGLVALEAMLAGVPVVASRVGGLPEVLGDCGLLVESERPDLLAAAIRELAADPAHRAACAACGASRAQARFSVEAMATGTEAAYRSLLAPTNGGQS